MNQYQNFSNTFRSKTDKIKNPSDGMIQVNNQIQGSWSIKQAMEIQSYGPSKYMLLDYSDLFQSIQQSFKFIVYIRYSIRVLG